MPTEMIRGRKVEVRRIGAGTPNSLPVDARTFAFYGMLVPAGATAATFTFQVSDDAYATSPVWYPLFDKLGAAVAGIPVTASAAAFDLPTELASWPYFRVVSGTNQAANLDLKFCKKG